MNRVEEIEKRLAGLEEARDTGRLANAALAFATTDIRFLLDALKESSARVEFLEKALGELYTLVDGERLLVRDGSVWVSYGDAGFQPAPSLAGYIDALKEQGGKP